MYGDIVNVQDWSMLARHVERRFATAIGAFTQDLWKEDAVLIALLQGARAALAETSVSGRSINHRITARLFKADGKIEEKFGDAAIIVRINYRDGDTLTGVAFYEAKVRAWSSTKIPQARRDQLKKMHRNLYNGMLLILDRAEVATPLSSTLHVPWWESDYRELVARAPVTNAIAAPLGPVLQANNLNTDLYKFGVPWSSQLILRNLQGLDLDHDDDVVAAASGYATDKGVPSFVLAATVTEGPAEGTQADINTNTLKLVE